MTSGHSLAKLIDDCFEDEYGTRRTNDGERLTGEQVPRHATDGATHEALHGSNVVLSGRAEQTSERDDGREAGEVDEEEGSETLDVDGVAVVASVPRNLALDVLEETTKEATSALQGWITMTFLLFRLLLLRGRHSVGSTSVSRWRCGLSSSLQPPHQSQPTHM